MLLGALLLASAQDVSAQVKPSETWRTIETPHFRVTYATGLEAIARRAGARAEEAYVELAAHFRPPRGTVDIVVGDNYDSSNGTATAYPSNRIVLYASPPFASGPLRFTDDYLEMLVAHELFHVFQLDRSRGMWSAAQRLFGRAPFLFPNVFQPSWVLEGLATRYESELTGSGRLVGTEHRMLARAAAMAHATPRLDQLSLAYPRYPYGYTSYAWGSLFMHWLGETHGDSAVRRYIEASSSNVIPILVGRPARRAFGRSFTSLYAEWVRTLRDSAPAERAPMPEWRELTGYGAFADNQRWVDDSTLLYTGTSGRESYALYRLRLTADGVQRTRLARRHSDSPQRLLPDGSIVYSQREYADPYTVRSDLYLDRPRGGTIRLTRNARLSMPDARPDGRIVAVQTVPGATRLVLVPRDGREIVPVTSAFEATTSGDSAPVFWSAPRWSPDGARIAAVRRGVRGVSELVLLDTSGSIVSALFRARAVVSKPSWSRDAQHVYFASDHEGVANVYRARVDSAGVTRVSDAATGLFEPEPSPDGTRLAAILYRADGYHLGVAPLVSDAEQAMRDTGLTTDTALTSEPEIPAPDSLPMAGAASRPYRAWRSMLPRFWVPVIGSALGEDSWRLGAYTAGKDLVGRHEYRTSLSVPTDQSGITGWIYYRNASFTRPLIELGASQAWENRGSILDDDGTVLGQLRRRLRDGYGSFTLERPRARSYSFASAGGGVEQRIYATHPGVLLQSVPAAFRGIFHYPRVFFSAGWSNTQAPPLAISPEDGISLAATTRYRWRTSDSLLGTHSVIAAVSGFKSLDLPGFAHHVAALRIAAGETDDRATGYLEVGGVSGGFVEVLPGHALGEGSRTFQVRGFPAGSMLGMRALAGNLEYRAPFLLAARGLGALPLFFDRTSLTVFGDAGTAWCPGLYPTRNFPDTAICTVPHFAIGRTVATSQPPLIHRDRRIIASTGAELNINAALFTRDVPFLYRLGVAVPVAGKELVADVQPVTWYFTVGVSF